MKRVWVVIVGLVIFLVVVASLGINAIGQIKKQAEAGKVKDDNTATVERGDVSASVIETGSLEAVKTVEVKSRVGGRIAQLMVDEGDYVQKGDLIAVVDPQETELRVEQDQAQLKGAMSSVRRLDIEIAQQRVTLQNAVKKAEIRIAQLKNELKAQPVLTNAAIKSAETSVQSAQKSHDILVNVTQPNAKIAAQNAVDDAKNNLEKSKLEEARQKELYELGYGTKRAWEQAELQRQINANRLSQTQESLNRLDNEQRLERERSNQQIQQAQAELARAKANSIQDDVKVQDLQRAEADLRDAKAQLKNIDALKENKISSQASVEQLQSVLSDSKRQLGETEIRAPFSGIISSRTVQVGELVSALSTFSTGTPIVTLEDRSAMLVKLQINEIDVAKLSKNMESEVTVDAFPNQNFSGHVTKISPSQIVSQGADPVVKYDVEVQLDSVTEALKGGMSAKCTMKAINKKNVLRLPIAFVGLDEKGRFVEVATEEKDKKTGKVINKRIDIVTGEIGGKYIEVISGVDEGTKVVKPEYKGPSPKGMMSFGDDEEGDESSSAE